MSSSDRLLVAAFGSLNPSVGAFPHCIFENSARALISCCSAVEGLAAPWRVQVAYEADGRPFVRDDYTPEMVGLWAEPQNQSLLPKMMSSDLEFPLLIPAGASPEVIGKMWSSAATDYHSCLEGVPRWLDALGWVYIQLEYEYQFAMFVAAKPLAERVSAVERRLAVDGISSFRLTMLNDRYHWNGPCS